MKLVRITQLVISHLHTHTHRHTNFVSFIHSFPARCSLSIDCSQAFVSFQTCSIQCIWRSQKMVANLSVDRMVIAGEMYFLHCFCGRRMDVPFDLKMKFILDMNVTLHLKYTPLCSRFTSNLLLTFVLRTLCKRIEPISRSFFFYCSILAKAEFLIHAANVEIK